MVSNGTLDVGVVWTGSAVRYKDAAGENYYGSVSNNVLHVAGTNPLVRVTASAGFNATYCKGALTLVYDTIVRYDVPEAGYVATPIQVTNHKLELHRTTIPEYKDTQPACRLVLNARPWARKHPQERLVLMETAQDSATAMQELVDHASFPDLAGTHDEPGVLTIEDGGTKLVYTAPARRGMMLIFR